MALRGDPSGMGAPQAIHDTALALARERCADELAEALTAETRSEAEYRKPVEEMVTKMAEQLNDESPRYSLADRITQWRKQAEFTDPPDESTLGGMYASGRAFAFDRCADEAEMTLAGAEALTGGGWQPIETAPKDGTKVLVLAPSTSPDPLVALYSKIPSFAGWWAAGNTSLQPTHWMPLPSAPTETKK